MDESLSFLLEARSYVESFIDVSLADFMFEETEEMKEKNEHNEKAKIGALDALKKAFSKLIEMVKNTIERITNFFKERMLSKEEKERFKEFKEMVKKNPELAKQKITIADFRAYEKAYDEALKELENEAKKENPSDEIGKQIVEKLSEELKNITEKGKGIATKAAISTTLDTAIQIADRNTQCAKAINAALKAELISLESVEKELGEKEVAKFEKKIERLSKAGFLHRWKVKIFHHKEMTLEAVLKSQFKKFLSFTNVGENGKVKPGESIIDTGSILKGVSKNPKLVSDALGGPKEAANFAKDMAMKSIQVKKAQKDTKKFIKKSKKDAEEFMSFITGKK